MKDKVLTYAIGISLLAHVAVAAIVGHSSAQGLKTAKAAPIQQRILHVDMVRTPDDVKEAPKPVARPIPTQPRTPRQPVYQPDPDQPQPQQYNPTPDIQRNTRPINTNIAQRNSTSRASGKPGSGLRIGSRSEGGDLSGNWGNGRNPSGYVPGDDRGKGTGSGSGEGNGTPEPVKGAVEGPSRHADPPPAPAPPPPPEPRMVSVRVCVLSGMKAGDHCRETRSQSFVDGREPGRTCDKCKPPEPVHKSRLADRAEPGLIKDSEPDTRSLDEGLSVSVLVGYTVTEDGDVSGVRVIKSSGVRAVDNAVVKAASKMRYKPAVQDGVPRSAIMTRSYRINT